MQTLGIILVLLLVVNAALGVVQLLVILKFERLLSNASQGAADHFEKLRKVSQSGV